MAKHLARIHGTEEDKVNCPFYFKIGACRHADRCSRIHHRPAFSPTILFKHVYRHPVREAELQAMAKGLDKSSTTSPTTDTVTVDKEKAQEDFLQFFENMYEELGKFGSIESLHVCDNLGDHMIGHVYVKFSDEEEASDALNVMNGRYYDGRKMEVEFSPVVDFREARCRDFDEETCGRGGFCNFMHVKPVPICLIRSLEADCEEERRREEGKRKEREHRDRERSSSGRRKKKSSRREREHRDRDGREYGSSSRSSSKRERSSRKRHRSSRSSNDSEEGRERERERERERTNDDDSDDSHSHRSRSRSPPSKRRARSYSRSRSQSRSNSPISTSDDKGNSTSGDKGKE